VTATEARRGRARRRPRRRTRKKTKYGWLIELPIVVVVALAVSLLLKTFLVQAFWIPSGSMEETLLVGDRVLVEKGTTRVRDVQRGDVVVFRDPGGWLTSPTVKRGKGVRAKVRKGLEWVGLAPDQSGDDLIKRVIGVPGDRVVCCDKKERLTVNGTPLDEPYLYPDDKPSVLRFNVTVPDGSIWVMGDHRSDSQDSRVHQSDGRGGMVPLDNVIGRAFVVAWPVDRWARLSTPDTFEQPALNR
jgi:signal peptidase I